MEIQQSWRVRFSFKNATIVLTILNVITFLFLLQSFLTSASTRNNRISSTQFTSVQLRYIKESEEIRLAMQPWRLIKRVKEIEQEANKEVERVQKKETAAVDLSKRFRYFHSTNDPASLKALEEWQKRKMERDRQRQLEKNGTGTSQA